MPVNAQSLAAARDMLTGMLVDSGALQYAVSQAFGGMHDQMQQQIESSDMFRNLTAAHQQSVRSYFDSLPDVMNQEMSGVVPQILDQASPRVAAMFTETQMHDVAAFVRTSAGRNAILRGVAHGATNNANAGPPPSDTDAAAEAAFDATPSGQAFNAHGAEFNQQVGDIMNASFSALVPHLQQRMARDLCDRMESECPPNIRAAASGAQ
jgi:hypothetical protein